MTFEDFEIIKATDIENYIDECPMKLALKGVDKAICTQVKYLQKAKSKLPDYYDARCVIAELSFEQSSSVFTSSAKDYSGNICLDLTCGIGSDSLRFSKQFTKVVSIEQNKLFATIARHNFKKLGVNNIEIIEGDSLEYMKNYKGELVDLLFIDPARRSDEKRVFLFEDCSPNVFEILKYAPKVAKHLVIKASPLYDVEQAKRDFERFGNVTIETVSYNNECKELVINIKFYDRVNLTFRNTIISKSGEIVKIDLNPNSKSSNKADTSKPYQYLYIADVSFYKSRTFDSYISENFPLLEITSKDGVALSEIFYNSFVGRKYRIENSMPYKPKIIKQYLKINDIKSATIIKRGGKLQTSEIAKQLNLKDGPQSTIIEVHNTLFFLNPIN